MLQFDDVLKHILGEFGKYQKVVYVLISLISIPCAYNSIGPVFLAASTNSWCKVPDAAEVSAQICLANFTDDCAEMVKILTIPSKHTDVGCGTELYFDQCYRYNITYKEIIYSIENGKTSHANYTKIKCDRGWEYDTSQYKSTVPQQFDLVCDREYLNALATSMYMVGFLIGSFVFGYILDRIGRKKGFLIGVAGMTLFGVITAFSTDFWMFAFARLLVAITAYGAYLGAFVFATEITGPSKRTFAGMVFMIFFGAGYMMLALYGYLIREWKTLQLVMSIPTILFLSYWWLIPESPRWLIAVGRNEEAEKIIRKCGRINNVIVPDDIFSESWNHTKMGGTKDTNKTNEEKGTMLDLFRLPNMRKKTLILFYNWLVNTLIYYGLAFNTSNLGGSDYFNCFLAGAVEIPAYAFGLFIMDTKRMGRRWSMFYTMVIGGITCVAAAFVPPCGATLWIGITLATISKFSVTCSFGMVYTFSAELFPTPLRSTGVGMCSMCARIGGILAPQLLLMSKIWAKLPAVVFGVSCILAGILILPLPETRGKKLPETLEEGERFGKKPKKRPDVYSGYGKISKVEEENSLPMEEMVIS
ncbi:organic cation transporter protein-like isoform X2 [Ptychodera flava]|uniref:organic cation transporter protein-like isoform X2 n=1 Tax=Ptychodera flava TaxID=63121 RepID=UPI003969C016